MPDLFITSGRGADPGASPTPDPIDQKIQDLMDKSNGSTPAIFEAAREGDQELNRVYGELMQKARQFTLYCPGNGR